MPVIAEAISGIQPARQGARIMPMIAEAVLAIERARQGARVRTPGSCGRWT
jgi:hypothetical protein